MRQLVLGSVLVVACGGSPDDHAPHGPPAGGVGGAGGTGASGGAGASGGSAGTGGENTYPGEVVEVDVLGSLRTHVSLSAAAVVGESDPWDVALVGWDVLTSSGPSGPGDGASFGPLDRGAFFTPGMPEYPFLKADETGGAFNAWYLYDGGAHALWSRYHVYGVRRLGRTFKVQVLGYYGEQAGAPVSALYQVRYAEVTAAGSGVTVDVVNLDATAGGLEPSPGAPSGCLDLTSGTELALSPDEARASTAWDLCFRRDSIGVNGELGGPGDVTAVDLRQGDSEGETLAQVQARTAQSERAAFDAVDAASLAAPGLVYRGDRIRSMFSDRWADFDADPPRVTGDAWLVRGHDGSQLYLLLFEALGDASRQRAGRLKIHVVSLGTTNQ